MTGGELAAAAILAVTVGILVGCLFMLWVHRDR